MSAREPLYEGKAKIIFKGPEDGTLIQYFKDDATAFNAQKKDVITGKGVLNNHISEHIMLRLADAGITTHFIERMNDRERTADPRAGDHSGRGGGAQCRRRIGLPAPRPDRR